MQDKYRVKLVSTELHNFKLFMFGLYNIAYVLYMTEFIGRSINLMLLFLFIAICLMEYIVKNNWVFGEKDDLFWPELVRSMVIVLAFLFISISIQILQKDVRMYLYKELLYNLLPPIIAFVWINTSYSFERYTYFVIFFLRNISYFIINNIKNFSLSNIQNISWVDSKSSVFEAPYAHDFFFLEIIFLYFGKKRLAFISMIFCMLSFKRISFILSLVFYVAYVLYVNQHNAKEHIDMWKPIKRGIRNTILIALCITPFIIQLLVTETGLEVFYNIFGIDLNVFTSGRVGLIKYTVSNIGSFNGYGSSDAFLENSSIEIFRTLGSMHCDILRLLFETTIIGVFIFAYEMLEIAKKNWVIFLMLIYLFGELVISHFMDNLGVWNMFFMFTAMVYAEKHAEKQKNDC